MPANRHFALAFAIFGLMMAAVIPASAQLNFNFTYDSVNSTPPSNLNGNSGLLNDANGDILMDMMTDAGGLWNDVIRDNWTINVELRWEVPTLGNNFSGQMTPHPNHPLNVDNDPAEQNNRIVWTLLRMNPNRTWWVDPTPFDSSEFNMNQTLYRDLSSDVGGQQSAWYDGDVPNLVEVGYQGSPNGTAPAIMQNSGTRDLLTVALHELGHTVGIGGSSAADSETMDGDYDIPSQFVGGSVMEALSENSTNNAHINPSSTPGSPVLMCVCGLGGTRRLPSAMDVFAGATSANWTSIHLPRTDFLTGNDWNTASNWEGNRVPNVEVEAFVRHGGTVNLSGNAFPRRLTVDEDSTLVVTPGNRLSVNDRLTVQNLPGTGTTALSVSPGGELAANRLVISSGSRLLTSGLVDANDIEIAAGGELLGAAGTVVVSDVIGDFDNNGQIAATLNGTLTIDSDNLLDLDGTSENGTVRAVSGNVVIAAPLTDSFNGVATIGAGRTMTFNGGFDVGPGGLLHLDGQAGNGATVNGIVAIGSGGVLRGDGRAIVNSAITLNGGGTLETEDAAVELRLNGFTNLAGGQIRGPGAVLQTGDADVTANTTIAVATYDMDGFGGNSTIDVLAGRTLRIESASLETTTNDGYDGTLNINNGTVDIVAPWQLEGTLNLNDSGAGSPELTGAGGVTVQGGTLNFNGGTGLVDTPISVNNGTVFVDGVATMNGPTTLGANATVDIDAAGDSLRLTGQTTLIAPTIVGSGRLIFQGSVNISFADTTIGVAETDLDGMNNSTSTEITINNGLTLSIASTTIEPIANDGFAGTINNFGTLSILAGWRLDGTLNMDPTAAGTATLDGGPFEIFNSGLVIARDEVLINPATTVAGDIRVISGRTQTNGNVTFQSTATVNISASSELELNGNNVLSGGTYVGAGTLQLNGPTTVDSDTNISVNTVDLDGPENTVVTVDNSRLTLNVDQIDTTDNRFDGVMHLNGPNAQLAVNLTSGGPWQMDGIFNANGAAGSAREKLTGSPVLVTGILNVDNNVQFSAPLDIHGTLTLVDSSSEAWLANTTHTIRNTAAVSGAGQVVVAESGTLQIEDGATINAEVFSLGRLEPGTSTGTAIINDDYSQQNSGVLGIELAGAPGIDQDLLQVSGAANLAGELEVTVVDGTMASIGSVYTILTADSVVGTFDTFTLLSDPIFQFEATLAYPGSRVTLRLTDVTMFGDFNDDLVLDCVDVDALVAEIVGGGMGPQFNLNGDAVVNHEDLEVWLTQSGLFNVAGAYLPGDANLDGMVSEADFDVWNANRFMAHVGWCGGDFDADGVADVTDLNIWNSHKGLASFAVAVPEPTAYWLVVLSSIVLLMFRDPSSK